MAELYGNNGGSGTTANNAIERAKIKLSNKTVEVQFNPGSLSFSSSFSDSSMSSPAGTSKDSTSSGKASGGITMSVDLLFDAVNKGVKERNKQPVYMARSKNRKLGETRFFPEVAGNVNKDVNTFYSLMLGESGRDVEFMWGKLSFKGNITSVSMEITLFDRQANPLRTSVKLQIRGAH